jgi:hypothetical protein
MSTTIKVVATFCLAGLLSAWTFCSYSAWVDSLYKANSERQRQMSPGHDPVAADRAWYAENISLTKYADRQWLILCLGFPVAMSLAMLIAILIGWLPRVPFPRILGALSPVYFAPALVFLFSSVSHLILLLPSLAAAAFLLRLSAEIFASRRPRKFILSLLISATICCLLWVFLVTRTRGRIGDSLPQTIFFIAMEMAWASFYGKALTGSDVRV